MHLEFTDDQQALRDNISSVLAGVCPPSLVRAVFDGDDDGAALWRQLADLGWPALAIRESAGGLGFGFIEVGLLAEALGRAAAPGPLLATIATYVPVLEAFDCVESLAAVAAGQRSGSLVIGGDGTWPGQVSAITFETTPAGPVLSGMANAVLCAAHVDAFAVVAADAATGELGVFDVEASDVAVTPRGSFDPGLGLADLSLVATPGRVIAVGQAVSGGLARVRDQIAAAVALHAVGAARQIFEMTLAYAKVRIQYDRAIGSFQALKHRFADLYLAVEKATAVGYYAAAAIAEGDQRRAEAAHLAQVTTADCLRLVVEDGLQLHGGIGFTWEHDLHFWLKRAKACELIGGSAAYHRACLAELLGLAQGVSA